MKKLITIFIMTILFGACAGMGGNEFADVGDKGLERFCNGNETQQKWIDTMKNLKNNNRYFYVAKMPVEGSFKVENDQLILDGMLTSNESACSSIMITAFILDENCTIIHKDKQRISLLSGTGKLHFEVPFDPEYNMYYWYRYFY